MAGKIEQTEQALTDSVTQAEHALTALGGVVESEEGAGGLPEGWVKTTIGDVLAPQSDGKLIHQGWSPRCHTEKAPEGEWGVLKTTAIQDGYYLEDANKWLPEDKEPKSRIEVEEGDLLMTNAGPRARCGVTTLVRKTREKLMLSGKMYRMRFNFDLIHSGYIEACLRSEAVCREIDQRKTGISESGLNLTQQRFLTVPLILSPYEEQKEIVQTLDTLLAQVDNIKTRLDAIPNILKTFRQSVLAAAVSGKLSEAWRGGSMSVWNEGELESYVNKKAKSLSEDELQLAKELTPDAMLPDWVYYPLEKLVDATRGIPYGIVQTGVHFEGGVPTVRCGDVNWLSVDTSNLKLVDPSTSSQYKRTILKGSEVVLAIRGTVGNAAVVPAELKDCNISREVALIPLLEIMNPKFIALLLQSPVGYRRLAEKVRGVAQKGINLADVKRFVTPVPTVKEQTEIIRRVEEFFAFADQIEQQVKNAQGRVNNLTQSILGKAFRGELTAQWRAEHPDLITGDNSAEALLAKIQAERDALKKSSKPKKTPKKKATAKKSVAKKAIEKK